VAVAVMAVAVAVVAVAVVVVTPRQLPWILPRFSRLVRLTARCWCALI